MTWELLQVYPSMKPIHKERTCPEPLHTLVGPGFLPPDYNEPLYIPTPQMKERGFHQHYEMQIESYQMVQVCIQRQVLEMSP